jgi:histidinol-phosphate aminotransferase
MNQSASFDDRTLAARARGLRAYQPPPHKAGIDLRLDANEGPGPDRAWLARLLAESVSVARLYPNSVALEGQIAQRHGVDRRKVVVTAGADDALARFCQATLEPGRQALATTPSFEMIPRGVRLAGGELLEIPWMTGALPRESMIAAANRSTAVVFVVSPNNPTGAVATRADLRELRDRIPHAILAVDLAYTEFADDDLTPFALTLPNTVILRTFSKAIGLAGLRVGYAIGPEALIAGIRAVGQPFSVSSVALAVASAVFRDAGEQVARTVGQVRAERAELAARLRSLGAEPFDSQANFVLCRFTNAPRIAESLADAGIAVRLFPGRENLENCIRITCPGDPVAFERLSAALARALD